MRTKICLGALSIAVIAGSVVGRPSQPYDFLFSPGSGLSGSTSVAVSNEGTLIGNWSAKSNPTGTRTKPGLFGTFGATENLPVSVTLGAQVGGNLSTQTAGSFRLAIDSVGGTVQLMQYTADFLSSGPASLPATISLLFGTFRTRSPDSTYIGGIPFNVPIGEVELTALTATQTGSAGLGTLAPSGPGAFSFTVAAPVEISGSMSILGNPVLLPPTPAIIALQGELQISGTSAHLTSVQPLEVQSTSTPGTALPQFPLDLPTILPPGQTAHLLMDLVLQEIVAGLNATLTTNAAGTLVPAPAGSVVLAAGLLVWSRRRR